VRDLRAGADRREVCEPDQRNARPVLESQSVRAPAAALGEQSEGGEVVSRFGFEIPSETEAREFLDWRARSKMFQSDLHLDALSCVRALQPVTTASDRAAAKIPLDFAPVFPCSSCGKFAFSQPTRCYWCATSVSGNQISVVARDATAPCAIETTHGPLKDEHHVDDRERATNVRLEQRAHGVAVVDLALEQFDVWVGARHDGSRAGRLEPEST
jgi:hypothetical protein